MGKNETIKSILDVIKDSAIFLLVFIGINILLTSILFLCHISISSINIVISLLLTVAFIFVFYNKKSNKQIIIAGVIAIVVFIVSIYICSHTYDLTWDGNTYHKLAIGMMKDGWNPVYQRAEEFIKDDITNVGIFDDSRNSIWIQHYPKASWIFSANIYSVTNNIESSKIITVLIMYVAFGLIINYLYKKTNIIFSFLISFLICINPISVVQAFSYYIDGLMGLCIYIILYALVALSDKSIKDEEDNSWFEKQNWLVLAISLIVCINLKFTGLAYSAIFCIMFFGLWVFRAYKEGVLKERLFKYISYYVVVVLIAICVVGFSPYIKNILNKGNPLYPLIGKDKIDIMTYNQPKSFVERGAIDKFFTSIFGVSENVKSNDTDKDPTLKFPFTIVKGEIKQYSKPDLRISGFGVWFSGIFIISLCGIVYFLYKLYKQKEYEKFSFLVAFMLVSAMLVLIVDGSWWARYVPYIYLLPIIVTILFAKEHKKIYKVIATIICVLLIANVSIITYTSFNNTLKQSRRIEKQMINIKKINRENGKVVISLKTDGFPSALYNLRDKHVTVELKEYNELNSPKYVNYFYYEKEEEIIK